MNTLDAYKILELNPNCSLDEAKKKHKDLVKKFHPDLNKDVDPQKMKQINKAFDAIKKHKDTKVLNNKIEDIFIHKTISYAEAIYGTNINVEYERLIQCQTCEGTGEINECKHCDGSGFITKTIKQNNNIFSTQTQCNHCINTNHKPCPDCFGQTITKESRNLSVKVPPGINNGSKLVLRGMGNYTPNNMMFSFISSGYKDAFVQINFKENNRFKLKDQDLHTNIEISFLESLKGFERTIKLPDESDLLVKSDKQINEPLIYKNLGLGKKGNLVVNPVIAKIPEDKLQKIIEILEYKNETNS
jgi:DnaJ-class molecular chaperone